MRLPYFDPIGPFQKSTPLETNDWFVPSGGLDASAGNEKVNALKKSLLIISAVVGTMIFVMCAIAYFMDGGGKIEPVTWKGKFW